MDNGSPVSEAYEPPFAYGGTIKTVKIRIQSPVFNASEQQSISAAEREVMLGME
jgi:hypothetical protein